VRAAVPAISAEIERRRSMIPQEFPFLAPLTTISWIATLNLRNG
jgi:hypothetical protein